LPFDASPPQLDVATINASPRTDYTQVTDPSVAFDGQGNVYVLSLQTSGAADGELYLTKFNFSGTAPVSSYNIYQWVSGSDAATSPVVAVDTSNPSAPGTPDPYANNVYIAWASIDTTPAANPTNFNPNRAELVVGTPISSRPSPNEQSLAFRGVTTVDMAAQPAIFTGKLMSGSTHVTGISIGTAGMVAGETITGTGVPNPPATIIQSVENSDTITLSAKATVTGVEVLTAGSLDPQQDNPRSLSEKQVKLDKDLRRSAGERFFVFRGIPHFVPGGEIRKSLL